MADPAKTESGQVDADSTLQTVGFGLTFLYYFTGISLISTFVAARTFHLELSTGEPFQFGLVPGLLAGLLGAFFNRTISLVLPVNTSQSSQPKVAQALAVMGFEPKAELDGYQVYQRSPLRHWFSGSIFLQSLPSQITIIGRARHIKTLKKDFPL